MTDAWDWWKQALANPKQIGKQLNVSTDSPEQGFYKTRWPNKPWEPVAIWAGENEGDWVALRSGKPVDAAEIWNWCCRNPISVEAYDRALAGDGWEDDDPTVAAGIGHNVGSELEAIADQIAAAKQGAEAYAKIESDEQAAKAQSLRARMNELAGTADKTREAQKKPHWDAGQAVDRAWMPLVKEAKAVANMLRVYIEAHETRKLRERQRLEAERRREEAEREAERARAEEKARAALEAGQPVVLPPAPEPLPPPPPPVTPEPIKGSYGRAATVGTETVITAITDQDALYQYLRESDDLKACLLDLAKRAMKAGHTVPGIATEERAKIS